MPTNNIVAVVASGTPVTAQSTVIAALAALAATVAPVTLTANSIAADGWGNPSTGAPDNTILVVNCQYVIVP